ncbi:MAG: hypothetical protein CMM01_00465 [Rhodopirellula sp.]|nr:hypothetical protein [Rhodopirellula sp.]OUX52764.1 MAG: hypothetical protein CBE43_00080 [Rhodopirellula sp. TMED283]
MNLQHGIHDTPAPKISSSQDQQLSKVRSMLGTASDGEYGKRMLAEKPRLPTSRSTSSRPRPRSGFL